MLWVLGHVIIERARHVSIFVSIELNSSRFSSVLSIASFSILPTLGHRGLG
jgi:hypothetical protein